MAPLPPWVVLSALVFGISLVIAFSIHKAFGYDPPPSPDQRPTTPSKEFAEQALIGFDDAVKTDAFYHEQGSSFTHLYDYLVREAQAGRMPWASESAIEELGRNSHNYELVIRTIRDRIQRAAAAE